MVTPAHLRYRSLTLTADFLAFATHFTQFLIYAPELCQHDSLFFPFEKQTPQIEPLRPYHVIYFSLGNPLPPSEVRLNLVNILKILPPFCLPN